VGLVAGVAVHPLFVLLQFTGPLVVIAAPLALPGILDLSLVGLLFFGWLTVVAGVAFGLLRKIVAPERCGSAPVDW